MFATIFSGLVELVTYPIKSYMDTRKLEKEQEFELMKLEHQTNMAVAESKLRMAEAGQKIDAELDQMSMNEMAHSWKDEFVLMVFITPMMMAFVPNMSDYALKGFETIQQMPEWYVALIVGMVVVIYGMRGLLTKFVESKLSLIKCK